ncbi:transcriptional regulator [Muribaculum sp.]|uniref:helix-turn-helix transcriptional regulator n=1 Tax=Muribaculum sp. TaxID=1918611 RepID=UPI0023C16096|nr:transcriptional regulator [Muribaculum sp.]MDE5704933.1 transcriptional regulator [Muribaculum sp.]
MSNRQPIHIGHEIESRINDLNISKSEFARRIGTSKQNVTRILEKKSIDTAVLIRDGEVIDYNFFNLYADVSNQSIVQSIYHSAASLSGDAMVLNIGIATRDTYLAAENAELKHKLIEAQEKIIKLMEERK